MRWCVAKRAGLTGVFAAGVAPAVHAQATVPRRLASSFPESLDAIFGAADVFAKAVRAMSGGTVEIFHTVPYCFFGRNEAFAIGAAIPFGMNSRQTVDDIKGQKL